MTWWQALILGVIEGLTEYLPVSSTGHLLIAQAWLGIGTESEAAKQAADAYAICIQAGAILAVLGLYFARVRQMTLGIVGKDAEGLRMFRNVVVGFAPAAVLGLLLNDLIKGYLFGPWTIIFAWIVGGILILAVAYRRRGGDNESDQGKKLVDMTWQMALVIGFAQCIAMWPGTSRSLITIVFGVLVGLRLAAAVEFSFLLGVVTLGAATCYDGLKHGPTMLEYYGPLEMAIGTLAAFVSAVIAVKWMVAYLKKHGMELFGYYRIAAGLAAAILILTGVLSV